MSKKDILTGLLKGLIISYVITFLLLAALALFMYKCQWDSQIADVGIVSIYILSAAVSGFVLAGHVLSKRFLWGCFAGLIYALILVAVAIVINKGCRDLAERVAGPVLLCIAGGMIGGMFR